MERCLSVLVIIAVLIVVKAVRAAKSSGLDLPVALDRSLAEFFPARGCALRPPGSDAPPGHLHVDSRPP